MLIVSAAACVSAAERDAEIVEWEYAGKFRITTYCACRKCNGIWAGQAAANGEKLKVGRTIAVDPQVIPLDSCVLLMVDEEILQRVAADTGSAIKGNMIDLLVGDCGGQVTYKDIDVWVMKE